MKNREGETYIKLLSNEKKAMRLGWWLYYNAGHSRVERLADIIFPPVAIQLYAPNSIGSLLYAENRTWDIRCASVI